MKTDGLNFHAISKSDFDWSSELKFEKKWIISLDFINYFFFGFFFKILSFEKDEKKISVE